MREPFSADLLRLAQSGPPALQAAALVGLELWALLRQARAEADAQRDERLSFRLGLIEAALSLPEDERASV